MQGQKPQRLDHYMQDALSRYYDSRDPFGADGDFITAPEISQLFGEVIGIWAFQKWEAMNSPENFNLVEIGPGRGTLMADFLRGTENFESFRAAANIHLVETSTTLKAKQEDTLKDFDVNWHDSLAEIDTSLPCIIIANEFFDALPVRQFKYEGQKWLEHHIKDSQTVWEPANDTPIKDTLRGADNGAHFEYSKDQSEYASLMNTYTGAMLIIDYGYFKSSYGDSLQALHKHEPCAITDHFGDADITTHVDFEWLATHFKKSKIHFSTQANFLRRNGIDIRYHMLGRNKMGSGYNRLMDNDKMGNLFKVMEVEKF
ncbi:MAG: methyltransferase [Alphaproteobacteria bacterium]|nr:MAG: methyltransferase [Alphaproteobacteria bacterium]